MELYRSSLTSSNNYGWWIKETGHAPKWAEQDRHVHVNSEMTRYVTMHDENKMDKLPRGGHTTSHDILRGIRDVSTYTRNGMVMAICLLLV